MPWILNWRSEIWQLCVGSDSEKKGWALGSAVGAAALGVCMARGSWIEFLSELPVARERGDAEGAWEGGAACVWDGERSQNLRHKLISCSIPSFSSLGGPWLGGSQEHPAFTREAFHKPASSL